MTASLDDVTSATSEIETSGIKDALFTIKVDVNDSTFISQAAQYVSATYGYLDVPINNAAVGAQDPDIRTRMQAAMETNVVGPAVVAYSGRLVRIYIVDEMKNIQMRGVCPAAGTTPIVERSVHDDAAVSEASNLQSPRRIQQQLIQFSILPLTLCVHCFFEVHRAAGRDRRT